MRVNDLERELSEANPEQRELLERLLTRRGLALRELLAQPRPERRRGPLSFAQERLWVAGLLAPDLPFGNLPLAFFLRGPLDEASLRAALDALVRRHGILRSTIHALEGARAEQRVESSASVPLVRIDLRDVPAEGRFAEGRRRAGELALQPFDLASEPLFRAALLQLSTDEHLLLLLTHHLATDGWGIRVLLRELSDLYRRACAGQLGTLAPPPAQYLDYAAWQRSWLAGADLGEARDYWRRQLAGAPEELRLPGARGAPRRSLATREVATDLGEELSAALRALARRERVTLYAVLLAALQALLHRASGQREIVVGSVLSHRPRAAWEQLVGNFGCPVLLRGDLHEDPPFAELLQAAAQGMLEAQAHADLPLALLAAELPRLPRLQALLLLRDSSLEENLALPGLEAEYVHLPVRLSPVDLTVDVVDGAPALSLHLEARADLLAEAELASLCEDLRDLLQFAAGQPQARVSSFPRPRCRAAPARPVAKPAAPGTPSLRLEDWFYVPGWQPRDAPRGTDGQGLTTLILGDPGGLGRRLGARLRQAGHEVVLVRASDAFYRVGEREYTVCIEEGLAGYQSLLADLGPRGRLPQRIVHLWPLTPDASEVRLGSNLFHRHVERGFQALIHLAQAIGLGSLPRPLHITSVSNGMQRVGPEALSYPEKALAIGPLKVIPREFPGVTCASVDVELPSAESWSLLGTRRRQRALERLCRQLTGELSGPPRNATVALRGDERYELLLERRAPSGAGPGWVREGGVYLVLGGLGGLGALIATQLAARYRAKLVLVGRAPLPERSRWEALLADPDADAGLLARLRVVRELEAAGAEVVSLVGDVSDPLSMRGVLAGARERFGAVHGIFHAASVLESGPLEVWTPVAIERVLAPKVHGAQVLHELLPDGELELLVLCSSTGALVGPPGQSVFAAANAYLDAYARSRVGQRTRVLSLAWGLWRELRMSAELRARFGFEEDDEAADPRLRDLAAGLEEGQAAAALRRVLASRELPPHLAVSPADPRSLSLQLDLAGAAHGPVASGVEPAIFEGLSQIWRELLGRQSVAAGDHFFELGGTSLVAVRLFRRIKHAWGVDAPISLLVGAPTLGALAEAVGQAWQSGGQAERRWQHLVAMHPGQPRGRPFFLVAGMFGNVLNLRHLARLVGQDRPFYGLQARGLYGGEPPHDDVVAMARDYLTELRSVQPEGPYLLGGFSGGGTTAYEMAHQLQRAGERVAFLLLIDTPLPQRIPISLRDRLVIHRQRFQRYGPLGFAIDWGRRRFRHERARFRRARLRSDAEPRPNVLHNEHIEKAFLRAVARYQLRPYRGKLTLFRPPPAVAHELGDGRVTNAKRELLLPDNGWGHYVSEIEVHELPGDHDSIVLEPNVRVTAKTLRRCLERAEDEAEGS